MTIIKCKMCGGDMTLSEDRSVGMCEYCGSTMTLPRVDDEQRAALFNRGNQFRRLGEFDKALAIYENIVREDENDAEAHWCCALCRFGIEYVEDPTTFEYIPTCHRASFDSILEDPDYLLSITEVNKYFSSDEARKCAPTAYAIAQGAGTSDSNRVDGKATCWWWLRSPGSNSNYAAYVYGVGSVIAYGYDVDYDIDAVRPALWVNLGS